MPGNIPTPTREKPTHCLLEMKEKTSRGIRTSGGQLQEMKLACGQLPLWTLRRGSPELRILVAQMSQTRVITGRKLPLATLLPT